ncbi:MAG: hypothetical protein P1P84_20890 [Deferrisomatales bacterium]|nr:hypothetical protein [Deferrisomatales bacterium]
MGRTLTRQERERLEGRVAEAEAHTGTQLVVAVIDRCDTYPELPWKAFALGVVAASLAGWAARVALAPGALAPGEVLAGTVAVLAAGAAAALLSVFLPAFARLFLDAQRAELETRQYAESLFLSRELFATTRRNGVLLLVGMFERQVVVLPDRGLVERLEPGVFEGVVRGMTPLLGSGRVARALEVGLDGLVAVLNETALPGAAENELPDAIIEERGDP